MSAVRAAANKRPREELLARKRELQRKYSGGVSLAEYRAARAVKESGSVSKNRGGKRCQGPWAGLRPPSVDLSTLKPAKARSRALQKAWREANRERYRELLQSWKKANRAKVRASRRAERGKLIALLLPKQHGRCATCREELDPAPVHVMPRHARRRVTHGVAA
jgi:hypothetical protein